MEKCKEWVGQYGYGSNGEKYQNTRIKILVSQNLPLIRLISQLPNYLFLCKQLYLSVNANLSTTSVVALF